MKRIIISILLLSLCSCNDLYELSDSLINTIDDTSLNEFENKYQLIEYETNIDKQNEYLASLEASIINDAKVIPLNTSNKYVLTKIIKSNLNPIIINGLNYYKVKDCVVTKDIVNDTYYKQIHNNCSNNNLTYNLFFKNNEIKLDNTYSIAFNDVKIDSLDLYDYKNKIQNEVLLQCQDSLIEIDVFGNIKPSLADSYSISNDKLTYTFTLKDNIYFIDGNGNKYDNITANNFVDGFKYMLDKNKKIDLFDSIDNINEYIDKKVTFEEVGIKAIDDKTLAFSLSTYDSFFLHKLANNNLIPINLDFINQKGINYANVTSPLNMLYTGAYYPTLISDDKITLSINPYYYDNTISINTINYIKDNSNLVNKFNDGLYSEVEIKDLSSVAVSNLISRYTDNSIRYGLINTKRSSYEVYNSNAKSNKTDKQKEDSIKALNNINFRKALISCINKDIFSDNNKKIDNLTLYNNMININDEFMSYNDYVNLLVKDSINYNKEKAKEYLDKYIKETNSNEEIILDVLCYKNNKSMINKIETVKKDIEETLKDGNVKINIIYCDCTYDYYLAGHQKYKCYDLYFDFSVNCDYNNRNEYLKEIIKYI